VFILGIRSVKIHSNSPHFRKVPANMNAILPQFLYHFNSLKTKSRLLYLKTQLVPPSKQVAVCSHINIKLVNTAWAERAVVEC
jgi:hypothetical protein